MAWAFAKAGQSEVLLFTVLAREAEQLICDFTVQEVANTAWAFVKGDQLEAQLLMVLARLTESGKSVISQGRTRPTPCGRL